MRFFVLTLLFIPFLVSAQGFEVTPVKLEMVGDRGSLVEKEIFITNNFKTSKTFVVSFVDIDFSDNNLTFVNQSDFSIKNDLSVDDLSVEINPGQTRSVLVRMNDLSKSGNAVLLIRALENNENQETVSLSQVGILVLSRVLNQGNYNSSLVDFNVSNRLVSNKSNIDFSYSVNNKGDVYLNPYGLIDLSINGFKKEIIPIEPNFVLPETSRQFYLEYQPKKIGLYKAKIYLNRGYEDIIDERTVYFFVGSNFILITLLLLLILVIGLWYNKKQ